MSMTVKSEGNNPIPPLEPGVYTGVASALIDLGIQENQMFKNKQRKVIIVWTILGETITVKDEELPRVISKEYTMSIGDKSTLRKDLEAWRGKPFSSDELQGFNLVNILNTACQLQINEQERNGKTYTNIAAIMALPKGTKVDAIDEAYVFDTYDNKTWDNYEKIPNWIKERIKKALNLVETNLDVYIQDYEGKQKEQEGKQEEEKASVANEENIEVPQDDLPF